MKPKWAIYGVEAEYPREKQMRKILPVSYPGSPLCDPGLPAEVVGTAEKLLPHRLRLASRKPLSVVQTSLPLSAPWGAGRLLGDPPLCGQNSIHWRSYES